jgi:hypothetical protein
LGIAKCKIQVGNASNGPVSKPTEFGGDKPFDLPEQFLDFADRVASLFEALPESRLGRRIAD